MYDLFYNWLLPTSLAGALAVLVSLALKPVLKRLRWRWRRAALAAAFAFFLIPVGPLLALLLAGRPTAPALAQPLAPVGEALGVAAAAAEKTAAVAGLPPVTAPLAQPLPQVQATLAERALAALPFVWLAGALVFLTWQLGRYWAFTRGLNRISAPAEEAVQALWNDMCAGQGLAAAPVLRRCPGLPGPVLTGLWHTVLYLPGQLQGEALELALRHEQAHLNRADLWLKALVRFACRLHWFNPLCRWQAARLNRVCEYACDEQAVAGLTAAQRKAYGAVLLTAALPERLPAGASGFGSPKKLLKARLEALFAPAPGGRKACAAAVLALAAGMALTACAAAGFADGAAPVHAGSGSGSGARLLEQPPQSAVSPAVPAVPTPEPTSTPAPGEAVPTPMPQPGEKPALGQGEAEVRWAHWQEEVPYLVEYTLDESLPEGQEVLDRQGANGLREISGWEFLDQDGKTLRTEAVGSAVIQPAVKQLMRGNTSHIAALYGESALAEDMPLSTGTLLWPVPDYKYVSRWMSVYHKGADICADYGSPVNAMDSATVVTAGYHYSYGNYVILDHGNGYRTLYAHMSELAVAVGDGVAQGQVIGYVGATGNSTGNQCHVEVYVDGERRSLKDWFPNMEAGAGKPLPTPVPIAGPAAG